MKRAILAAALLISGAAVAQTADMQTGEMQDDADMHAETMTNTATDQDMATTDGQHMTHTTATMASVGPVVQPGNANPEEDARGITVLSDAAIVPAGWNGLAATGVGGPLLDPATGEASDADDESYPACSATVTDNCIQTYEVGRD